MARSPFQMLTSDLPSTVAPECSREWAVSQFTIIRARTCCDFARRVQLVRRLSNHDQCSRKKFLFPRCKLLPKRLARCGIFVSALGGGGRGPMQCEIGEEVVTCCPEPKPTISKRAAKGGDQLPGLRQTEHESSKCAEASTPNWECTRSQ